MLNVDVVLFFVIVVQYVGFLDEDVFVGEGMNSIYGFVIQWSIKVFLFVMGDVDCWFYNGVYRNIGWRLLYFFGIIDYGVNVCYVFIWREQVQVCLYILYDFFIKGMSCQ